MLLLIGILYVAYLWYFRKQIAAKYTILFYGCGALIVIGLCIQFWWVILLAGVAFFAYCTYKGKKEESEEAMNGSNEGVDAFELNE